jgi:hypothetical protein
MHPYIIKGILILEVEKVSEQEKIRLTSLSTKAG